MRTPSESNIEIEQCSCVSVTLKLSIYEGGQPTSWLLSVWHVCGQTKRDLKLFWTPRYLVYIYSLLSLRSCRQVVEEDDLLISVSWISDNLQLTIWLTSFCKEL